MPSTRRAFVGAVALSLPLCAQKDAPSRLKIKPGGLKKPAPAGQHPLGLRADRDALLYIPESASKSEAAPLVVSLHGATRDAQSGIDRFRMLADHHGFLLLAPASEIGTWDAIRASYGPDPAFISRSISRTMELRAVDPKRIAMAGFSDGASYSLSIGLANGDLFRAVFGFSPGFVIPGERIGKPPVFISHGRQDNVLPIDQCSRVIVPELKRLGYDVTYREFDGRHQLPPEIAADAMQWFMAMS